MVTQLVGRGGKSKIPMSRLDVPCSYLETAEEKANVMRTET